MMVSVMMLSAVQLSDTMILVSFAAVGFKL